ncbi:hypothetical protein PHLCEN_2v3328 [Hermanssonia centrifuga]|uniref:Uncharacterized protein n=1 Tax=Hermanssonia centrifuga TaxID=98765 RepID=A0A2R6QM98_9APHY|nr:hypothetical protein PHLCEN_2v3328 [Hermanssonia centrifuga]
MADSAANGVEISNEDPLIFYHGRWDRAPGTWWASSGLKLNIDGLQSLTLRLGENTTSPSVPVGFSLDYEPFVTVNISTGSNSIPLKDISSTKRNEKSSVLRITSQGWQDNRMNLESIVLNSGAKLLPYTPSKLAFQVIGDSLSAGQYLEQGVLQAWPALTAEFFKSEVNVNAQPGAALTVLSALPASSS